MSRSKFNPLITASVMSAVYLAGVSNVSKAVVLDDSISDTIPTLNATENRGFVVPAANSLGQQRYIIQLNGAAVARFEGNAEFSIIPRKPNNRLDVDSAQAQAYVGHLESLQTGFLDSLSSQLGRDVELIQAYQYAYNGLAVYLTPNEADSIANNAGVKRVILDRDYFVDTDAGPQLIGANNLWGRDSAGNSDVIFATGFEAFVEGDFGEGVVIGTLDTGTNFDHPSFAEVGGDGYVHVNPLGDGNFLGVCDSGNVDQYLANYTCNNKLIGGFDFVHGLEGAGFDIEGPEDENGHGSHTASTSGGNMLSTAEAVGITDISVSGVAPHATHITFDVCFNTPEGLGTCPGVSSIASVDQAIADGLVDVINFSIGGGGSPWTDPVSEAFLNATASGIFVAASAGNSGPGPGTLGHVEPWTASSGASTHNRRFSNAVTVTGPDPVPVDLVGALGIQGTGPIMTMDMVGTMEYSGNVDAANVEGCVAFPASSFDGLVAVISRGACAFADKVNNAVAADAIGVIVHNNVSGDPIVMGGLETTTVPSVMVSQSIGLALDAFIDANPGAATVSVDSNTSVSLDGAPDSMASFSSRGPSPFEYNKPDVTAPGVSILAAFNDDDPDNTGTPAEYGVISGTSMSSPHTAGAAALLRGIKPGWSVPEVKSALMMTAVTAGVTKEDGLTAADPFDRGAGRIQVDTASMSGLVMDETALNFALADPANGGDPKTLNVPSITDYNCVDSCTFQRGFRSVASVAVTYNASIEGVTGTVTPSSFTLNPGQFVVLEVEVDGSVLPAGATSFGELVIEEDSDLVFSVASGAAIPDDAYDGTLATMACDAINVSGVALSTTDAVLETGITHTWEGDLTVKLQNPNGDILGVMSRPGFAETVDDGTGCCGNNSGMDAAAPVSFADIATTSAEDLGVVGTPVCGVDGICEYSPFPDSVAGPATTIADLLATDPNGTWNVCVGDSGSGDTGNLVSSSLTFPGESSVPALHLPMVIVGFPPEPEIDVTPTTLSQTQLTDEMNDQVLNIANLPTAGADLIWSLGTDFSVTLAEQVDGTGAITDGIVSGFFLQDNGGAGSGAYSADDFVLTQDASIETMFFEGFANGATLDTSATAVQLHVYADDSGVPAGHPEDGLGLALFTLDIPIADPSLDLTGNNILIDIVAANGGSSLDLTAGTYWVTVFPTQDMLSNDATRWAWFAAGPDVAGAPSQLVSPISFSVADWTGVPALTTEPNFEQLRYNIAGSSSCGASWLSTSSSGSTVGVNDSIDVTVTFDSTGLAVGVYDATLCIDSNDTDEPQVLVPVTLTVDAP